MRRSIIKEWPIDIFANQNYNHDDRNEENSSPLRKSIIYVSSWLLSIIKSTIKNSLGLKKKKANKLFFVESRERVTWV